MNAAPTDSRRADADADADDRNAWLSALADGRADAVHAGCALWRDDDEARRRWHAYHLIGDVMRSEDLAARPARDAAFLRDVRSRLAAEPVVLAPEPIVAALPARRRPSWLLPGAAAVAGVAVVAGVLVVARTGATSDAAPVGATLVSAPMAAPSAGVQTVSVDAAGMVRDARLEELLRQHWSARGGVAVAAPPRALRPQPLTAVSAPGAER